MKRILYLKLLAGYVIFAILSFLTAVSYTHLTLPTMATV